MRKLITLLLLIVVGCATDTPTGTTVIDTVYVDSSLDSIPDDTLLSYTNMDDTMYIISRTPVAYVIYGGSTDDSIHREDVTSTEIRVEDSLYISAIFPCRDTMIVKTLSYYWGDSYLDTFYNISSKTAYEFTDNWLGDWKTEQMWKINKEKEELENE